MYLMIIISLPNAVSFYNCILRWPLMNSEKYSSEKQSSIKKSENVENVDVEQFSTVLNSSGSTILSAKCHTCPADDVKTNDKKRIIIASIVCFIFMVTEIVGGISSNSLAIATDAAHLLTDFGAFMVSLLSLYIASKNRTKYMNFGFYRAEVIGALVSVLSIWLMTGILLYAAVTRLLDTSFEINAFIMLLTAVFGIIANILLSFVLICQRSLKTIWISRKGINLKSAFIHVLGDFIHSVGVLIASLIIYFKPEHKIADPIITFIFSLIVLMTTYHIMRDVLMVLMEGFPRHIAFDEITEILFSVPQVVKVHNLRMWSLTLERVALSAHIVIYKGANPTEVLNEVSKKISEKMDIFEVTLQIEDVEPVKSCNTCN